MLALDNVDQSPSLDPTWSNRIKETLLQSLRNLAIEASAPMGTSNPAILGLLPTPMGPTSPAIAGLIPHAATSTLATPTGADYSQHGLGR